jgi:hypothetical protein
LLPLRRAMRHLSTYYWFLASSKTVFCLVVFFFIWKSGLIKRYNYLASLLVIKILTSIVCLSVIGLSRHGLDRHWAYVVYFDVYWMSVVIQAVLWLTVTYNICKLAINPLKRLQKLDMLVFRGAVVLSAIDTAIEMIAAFHVSNVPSILDIISSRPVLALSLVLSKLQQTVNILTLSLLLFVTFAIGPRVLRRRSRDSSEEHHLRSA